MEEALTEKSNGKANDKITKTLSGLSVL